MKIVTWIGLLLGWVNKSDLFIISVMVVHNLQHYYQLYVTVLYCISKLYDAARVWMKIFIILMISELHYMTWVWRVYKRGALNDLSKKYVSERWPIWLKYAVYVRVVHYMTEVCSVYVREVPYITEVCSICKRGALYDWSMPCI